MNAGRFTLILSFSHRGRRNLLTRRAAAVVVVAWGRPADVLVMPDGALLVSDDYAGIIYRIAYRKP